jgi:hypothetical protein
MRVRSAVTLLLAAGAAAWAASAPADRLPKPKAERCIPFDPDVAEGDAVAPDGISYDAVRSALTGVIQTALYCPRPAGRDQIGLTYELVVACDGLVKSIECSDPDDAPDDYVACIAAVLERADFPAHDMADGFPITYPVNVAW